jgi:poly(3-hydroxybutyrate) depolymerase
LYECDLTLQGRWISDLRPPPETPFPKTANETADMVFVGLLLRDIENLLCIDTARIYGLGMGTGAGMTHMLACEETLSNKFAAFAAVGAGFGVSKDPANPWTLCSPGRNRIPVAEIHGMEDRIFGYYLNEGENGKVRQIPPYWVEDWAERNGCGSTDGEPIQLEDEEGTFITQLDPGVLVESVTHSGGAIKIARRCAANAKATRNGKPQVPEMKDIDVLHYKVKRYGHGWPRQQLPKEETVILNDKEITPKGEVFFDTTEIILEFLNAHKLPEKHAKRFAPMDIPSQEEIDEAMKSGKATGKTKEIVDKIKKMQAGEKTPSTDDKKDEEGEAEDRDEL